MGIRPRGGGVRPSVQKAGPLGPVLKENLYQSTGFIPSVINTASKSFAQAFSKAGIPSWGMAAVDGTTAFALPADLLSAAAERRQRTPRGFAPGPLENGQRTPACGGCSTPPPCLSRAVWSTFVCAERFLVRPLGMGSGGGGPLGIPSLGFHSGDWQRLMAQRRLPFRRTSFLSLPIVKSSAKKNGRKFQQEISRKGICEVCDLAYG